LSQTDVTEITACRQETIEYAISYKGWAHNMSSSTFGEVTPGVTVPTAATDVSSDSVLARDGHYLSIPRVSLRF
jgi:hypothetical protein